MDHKTCIIYDERYLDHKTGHAHPEHPDRLKVVHRMIQRDFPDNPIKITPEPAPLALLETVHSGTYIDKVLTTAAHDYTSLAPDTPTSSQSYFCAWLAAGGCLKGLDLLAEGAFHYGFALVRPPGHHALPDRAGGFCIFNNLGITAKYAREKYGFERILIIDWDIHHGNGLQELFYHEKEVFYFSTHDMLLYPHSGNMHETGEDEGLGYTMNIPLPGKLESEEFLALYQAMLPRLIQGYHPDLILVAAGFDGHRDDPIGKSRLTSSTFGQVTALLMDLAARQNDPPILLSLEGGYNARALSDCVREVLASLTGHQKPGWTKVMPSQRIADLIESVGRHGRPGIGAPGFAHNEA